MAVATIPKRRTLDRLIRRLGGVPLERIRVIPPMGQATETDLLAVNARKRRLCELIDGTLVEKAMGHLESSLAHELQYLLEHFIRGRRIGYIATADDLVRVNMGGVRSPDISFYRFDSLPNAQRQLDAIAEHPPALVVEILSRSNRPRELRRKRREFFARGTRLLWEIDPRRRTVRVFITPLRPITLTAADTLDGGAVLPGFTLPLAGLFAVLDPAP